MDNLFNYVAGAFMLILVVMCVLLLFPFFPMLALCIVILCMAGTAVIVSAAPEAKQEDEVERAHA